MRKTLTYSGFVITSMAVLMVFLTARTYTQLGLAVVLYPILAFFAYKLFIVKGQKVPVITVQFPPVKMAKKAEVETIKPIRETVDVVDIDKRTFLKLIGATGLSFFIFSLLGRRLESFLFERTPGLGTINTLKDPASGEIGATGNLPLAGYSISEIDDNIVTYYGFINKEGAWIIMQEDTSGNSFRYAKGDSKFPANWGNRENLKYDYFYNLF
jgi:hypothetical protein